MIGTRERQDLYLSDFERFLKEAGGGPAWLSSLRKRAIERFAELGFPSTRNEDWKYTNVSPIAQAQFIPARKRAALDLAPADAVSPNRLVFVNGFFSRELSALAALPQGVKATSLAGALAGGDEKIESHLARYARFEDHAFVALNTAFFEDGALVEVPAGVALEDPIQLLFITSPDGAPVVTHPRILILAGRGSRVAVVEDYRGEGGESWFTNTVTEIVAGEGASVDHYKLQMECERAFHVATVQCLQERYATLTSCNLSFGGALVRNEINSVLDGEGAEAVLDGLFVASGRQHMDNHSALDHAKPHCNSRELYKGILDGQASGVFNGKILVRKDAQKTNAIQSNKNLLLSEDAVINTKPQLEIFADDVRCTHGATVGQLDQEALFYLRSRGIGRPEARDLLTYAFAGDIFDRMKLDTLRSRLEAALYRKLSKGRQN